MGGNENRYKLEPFTHTTFLDYVAKIKWLSTYPPCLILDSKLIIKLTNFRLGGAHLWFLCRRYTWRGSIRLKRNDDVRSLTANQDQSFPFLASIRHFTTSLYKQRRISNAGRLFLLMVVHTLKVISQGLQWLREEFHVSSRFSFPISVPNTWYNVSVLIPLHFILWVVFFLQFILIFLV